MPSLEASLEKSKHQIKFIKLHIKKRSKQQLLLVKVTEIEEVREKNIKTFKIYLYTTTFIYQELSVNKKSSVSQRLLEMASSNL